MKVDGDPQPWLDDLRVLATVAALTAVARPELADRLSEVVREAAEAVRAELPVTAELELELPTAPA
jgi:hypothetical protein